MGDILSIHVLVSEGGETRGQGVDGDGECAWYAIAMADWEESWATGGSAYMWRVLSPGLTARIAMGVHRLLERSCAMPEGSSSRIHGQ